MIPQVLWTLDFTPNEPPELKRWAFMIRKLYEQLARVVNQLIDFVNSFSSVAILVAQPPINLAAQGANVLAATLFTVPVGAGGLYLIEVYMVVTRAATTSSTLPDSRIKFTDNDSSGAITIPATPGLATNTTATFAQGTFVVNAKAGTTIQYDIGQVTPFASVGGTSMQFAYKARALYLG
jgi:hypothetical protein